MSDLFERLKTETRVKHDDLENSLDFMREDMTLEDYLEMLQRFYGYYFVFEGTLKTLDLPFPYHEKVPALVDDMNALGMTDEEIRSLPLFTNQPSLETTNRILGSIYVIEGSTLGGMVLQKHFAKKFGLEAGAGLSFFSGYGAQTMPHWMEFKKKVLEHYDESNADEVLDNAKKTFEALNFALAGR
jgi:heme oxygenase